MKTPGTYLDTATDVFSLSHDEGVPVLRSSHNSDAKAWGNTAEGGGEG